MTAVPYLTSALWGLALLASFVGLGRWIAAGLRVRERAHVGLELVWGFAATLSVGGWLCCLGIATRPVLAVLVGFGVMGCLVPGRRKPTTRGVALRLGLALLCLGLLGLSYGTALLDASYRAADDGAAYFFHARKILETGSLVEPFSFRRAASYGGQSFLQAQLLVVAPVERLHLLDKGVCRLGVAIALVAHFLARPTRSLPAALLVLYAVATFPDIALNTSSLFSGVLAFAGLWMTLELCRRKPGTPITNGLLTGLVVAGAIPLRQNYLLASALVVLFEHARRLRTQREPGQRTELLVAAGSLLLGLAGWMLLQVRSCGTPLFPLMRGFANPTWSVAAGSVHELSTALGNFVRWPLLSTELGICALAMFLRPPRAPKAAGLGPFAAAAWFAFLASGALLAHSNPSDVARYTAAFLFPAVLFAAARSVDALARVRSAAALRDGRLWLGGVTLVALFAFLPPVTRLAGRVRELKAQLGAISSAPEDARRYENVQRAAPTSEKLLVMLDAPYLLDLRRNDVVSLDLPGGAGPPPGLWTLGSARDTVGYFRGLGYSWLAAVRPDRMPSSSVYSLEVWTAHANGVRTFQYDRSDVAAWQVMGRTVIGFFDQLEAITRSCRLTLDDGDLVMIDLGQCRFDPTLP